jgi:hypothetical protein
MAQEGNRRCGWLFRFAFWRLGFHRQLMIIMIFLATVPTAYFACYRMCLAMPALTPIHDYESGKVSQASVPVYWWCNSLSFRWNQRLAMIFEPANRLDRVLRPRYWSVSADRTIYYQL